MGQKIENKTFDGQLYLFDDEQHREQDPRYTQDVVITETRAITPSSTISIMKEPSGDVTISINHADYES